MTWEPLEPAFAHRDGVPVDMGDQEMFQNQTYVVIRRELPALNDEGPMIHLSIRRQDRTACKDWRDFQRIKNQLAGEDYEGIEIYPAEHRKVDTANQYHLWCLPFSLGIGLGNERMVTNDEQTRAGEPGAAQRDNEPIDGPLNTTAEMIDWRDRAIRQGEEQG